MKFKVDENLPVEIAASLRNAGYDAVTIKEEGLSGFADPSISEICQDEARAIVTLDMDFADVRAYPPDQYPGIIVLRVRSQDKHHVISVFGSVLSLLGQEIIAGRLWIVEESRVRVRGE